MTKYYVLMDETPGQIRAIEQDRSLLVALLRCLPPATEEDIVELEDTQLEQSYDKRVYLAGKSPVIPSDELEMKVRAYRDELLVYVVDEAYKYQRFSEDGESEALKQYRQALLDVPQQDGFPETVVWPEIPEGLLSEKQLAKVPKLDQYKHLGKPRDVNIAFVEDFRPEA